jgi:hypothetical protein
VPGGTSPLTIGLASALDLLSGDWFEYFKSLSHGQFALWLGSGISGERFPRLEPLLLELLERLYASVDWGAPNCRYKRALDEILGLDTLDWHHMAHR